MAKQMALKSVFDFDWADPTIGEGRADKGAPAACSKVAESGHRPSAAASLKRV